MLDLRHGILLRASEGLKSLFDDAENNDIAILENQEKSLLTSYNRRGILKSQSFKTDIVARSAIVDTDHGSLGVGDLCLVYDGVSGLRT